ncbi:glycosyltransferase [Buttiauxella gaviniae]|uniref:glycosyltransferase n=1 Tax=Buttiauxella gaviniae TaxID=82990 RepID=UPI003BB554D0
MSNKPLISVCIVTYNHEKYIRKCVESIIGQSVDAAFEIIISNDASTDNTKLILDDLVLLYPEKLRVVNLVENVGPYKNYRILHELARGKYIAHCDGDDYWLPSKLRKQMQFFDNNGDCTAVYTNAIVKDEFDTEYNAIFNNWVAEKFNLDYLVEKGNFLNHSSMIYRRDLKDLVIPSSPKFIDYMIHINLAKEGSLGYINEPLVVYRVNTAESLIRNQSNNISLMVIDALRSVALMIPDRIRVNINVDYYSRYIIALIKRDKKYCQEMPKYVYEGVNVPFLKVCINILTITWKKIMRTYFFRKRENVLFPR